MKSFCSILIVLIILLISVPFRLLSQTKEIVGGTDFWFAVPHSQASSNESTRNSSINEHELWVVGNETSVITIESADGISISRKSYTLASGEIKKIPISHGLMMNNEDQEINTRKAIHLISDEPVLAYFITGYMWTTDAMNILPVEALGIKYYTMNLYQDYFKFYDGEFRHTTSSITIVATENNTKVKFKPTALTSYDVEAGQTKTITLNKGDTYLIEAKIQQNFNFSPSTDLTGTYIESTEPIAVISGHTKCAYPFLSSTFYSLKADYMRATMFEMMLPVELLGCSYVTAPFKFTKRTFFDVIPDDRGDIIRFVATQPNTLVYQKRADGTWKQISVTLNAGQYCELSSMETAAEYKSNHPVVVCQYAKAWTASLQAPIIAQDNGDSPLEAQSVGQGTMLNILPVERWVSNTYFNYVSSVDAWLYLTFNTADKPKIKLDDRYIYIDYGSMIYDIAGSGYSYCVIKITASEHKIECEGGAKAGVYVYGAMDYQASGFTYSYPAGMSYTSQCPDSIRIDDEEECGMVNGKIFAVDIEPDSSCAVFTSINIKSGNLKNYSFSYTFSKDMKSCDYSLSLLDNLQSASATVSCRTKSGTVKEKTYTYVPEILNTIKQDVEFGNMTIGDSIIRNFTLKNEGEIDLSILDLYLKNNNPNFELSVPSLPFTIPANSNHIISILAKPLAFSATKVIDTLIAVLKCDTIMLGKIFYLKCDSIIPVDTTDTTHIDTTDTTTYIDYYKLEAEISLEQNHPNPFGEDTEITFVLKEAAPVELALYNTFGEVVRHIYSGIAESGRTGIKFNSAGLADGIYFYTLKARGYSLTKKLFLIR